MTVLAPPTAEAGTKARTAAGRSARADVAVGGFAPPARPGRAGRLPRPSSVPRGPAIQRGPRGDAGKGSCPSCDARRLGVRLAPKVPVSSPSDPAEAEAHAIADALVSRSAAAAPGFALRPSAARGYALRPSAAPLSAARLSAAPRSAAPLSAAPSAARLSAAPPGPAPVPARRARVASPSTPLRAAGLGDLGEGRPLPRGVRGFFEPRLGLDLAGVRVHTGDAAEAATAALGARAFAYGADIVFGPGELAPQTPAGMRLLAHELVHVAQQSHGAARVQRTTHGPGTPTNCHNWTIPLPPWIAGTVAHGQISSMLGIPPRGIPRASKIFMGLPSMPFYPTGFADLWSAGTASVDIAEIKSTATGSGVAAAEAAHYVLRHDEWLKRAPWADADDLAYATRVGSSLVGMPLDLSGRTGTDLALGAFWGDMGKTLHVEGDNAGAVVYWCTGAGVVGRTPELIAFLAAIAALKAALDAARRMIGDMLNDIKVGAQHAYAAVAQWIQEAIDWVAARSRLLAGILCLVLLLAAIIGLIVSILGAAPSGGTSSALGAASFATLVTSGAALLVLIGVGTPASATVASANLAAAASPSAASSGGTAEEYERGGGSPPTSAASATALIPANPLQPFLEGARLATNPIALARRLATSRTSFSAAELGQMRAAADAVAAAGDTATADLVKGVLA
jgi:hypothetical protein